MNSARFPMPKVKNRFFSGAKLRSTGITPEATAQKIDEEINKLIKGSYGRAKIVLNKNLDVLHKLAEVLLEKETVMGKELDELIHSLRPGIELPSKSAEDQGATTETAAGQS